MHIDLLFIFAKLGQYLGVKRLGCSSHIMTLWANMSLISLPVLQKILWVAMYVVKSCKWRTILAAILDIYRITNGKIYSHLKYQLMKSLGSWWQIPHKPPHPLTLLNVQYIKLELCGRAKHLTDFFFFKSSLTLTVSQMPSSALPYHFFRQY